MPWDLICPRVHGARRVAELCRADQSLRELRAPAWAAGVVLVGHAAVPDDDWALPGQSSDCLRTRAWPSSTCWTAHSAQAVPELINLSGPAADLHLQGLAAVPYAVRTLTSITLISLHNALCSPYLEPDRSAWTMAHHGTSLVCI